jgi:hypothetical protein
MDINPENQFDFWLGEWEATWGEDSKGTNHVQRILDGKSFRKISTRLSCTG